MAELRADLDQAGAAQPDSFDIGGLYNYQMFPIWPTGNFQPIKRSAFKHWNSYYPLFTKGRTVASDRSRTFGQGDAPLRKVG